MIRPLQGRVSDLVAQTSHPHQILQRLVWQRVWRLERKLLSGEGPAPGVYPGLVLQGPVEHFQGLTAQALQKLLEKLKACEQQLWQLRQQQQLPVDPHLQMGWCGPLPAGSNTLIKASSGSSSGCSGNNYCNQLQAMCSSPVGFHSQCCFGNLCQCGLF